MNTTKRFDELDYEELLKMKVGETATWNGYLFRGFYYEDDYCIEPDILGGVDVYKDDEFICAIHNEDEFEEFEQNV